jgi:predicted SAM-dependent methyltransferase
VRVNLGCGREIKKGWVNIDVIDQRHPDYLKHDLSLGLPEHIVNVKVFSSSHFFEHLTVNQGIGLMSQCHSRLLPGGIFYMEIPDFVSTLRAYLNKDWNYFNHPSILHFAPNKMLGEIVNYALHQVVGEKPEHVSFLDNEMAIHMLKSAGFREAYKTTFNSEYGNANPLRIKYSSYFIGIK